MKAFFTIRVDSMNRVTAQRSSNAPISLTTSGKDQLFDKSNPFVVWNLNRDANNKVVSYTVNPVIPSMGPIRVNNRIAESVPALKQPVKTDSVKLSKYVGLYEYVLGTRTKLVIANHQLYMEDPEFVLPSYTKRAPIGHILNHHMKPIVRGRGRDEVHTTNPHVFTTSHGTQDMEGRLIPPHAGHNIHGESCHNVMRINHYWAKSWEYFKTKKQVRGSTADRPPGAPGADIPDDFWHQQNFNDEDDTMMVDRFWPRVQEQIKQLKEKIQ
jgi:hypothetical protein